MHNHNMKASTVLLLTITRNYSIRSGEKNVDVHGARIFSGRLEFGTNP